MKTAHASALLLLWVAAAAAPAGSLRVVEELIYPTEYESQDVGDEIIPFLPPTGTGHGGTLQSPARYPIPTAFATREVGAVLSTDAIGVTRAAVISNRDTYVAKFHNGARAQFIDGMITVVDGVPYRALGARGDQYHVKNLNTGRVHVFRGVTAASK